MDSTLTEDRVPTGIKGLDEVLHGGFVKGRAYLVRGGPGVGKTTLGFHFLTAADEDERTLFVTLGEPETQLRQDAEKLGLKLERVHFLDLSPTSEFFVEVRSYDIFAPAEVERGPVTQQIVSTVEQLKPTRVFIDSMTQFRYLATDAAIFRRQTLAFLRFLMEHNATVLFTSESSPEAPDDDLQFLADGVLTLTFDGDERLLTISKFRGSDFRQGSHAVRLTDHGMEILPRLVPEEHRRVFKPEPLSSGVPELDELLGGGLERGTVTLITGPSGVGKTTLGLQFMKEAAGCGEYSVMYTFEEARENIVHRCTAVNIPVNRMMQRGTLRIVPVEPLKYTPDEFAVMVRHEVEENHAAIVMLDSLSGYRLSMRGRDLVPHLHALARYLVNMGVTTILVDELQTLTGEFRVTQDGVSYLADNIVFMRYLEINGRMRKAIGVLKKRLSDFETTLRETQITRYGIKVGEPLVHLRGILSGVPEWIKPPTSDRREEAW